jgi:3-oxoadipate enol-lactonase / 4-carboxymuconolactone decarboxylase
MIPSLAATDFGGPHGAPLLMVGPSLGTAVAPLWAPVADRLTEHFRVIGWDLPGHGASPPSAGFDIPALGTAVLTLADRFASGPFRYAGVSVGGAVGLQLLLDAPTRISAATLLCTGARIGIAEDWRARAALVAACGMEAVADSSAQRWYAAGFTVQRPHRAATLAAALSETDPQSYAAVCHALADFDVTNRLSAIGAPVCAVAGALDVVVSSAQVGQIASDVADGRFVMLDGVGHLAPAEAPERVANLIAGDAHAAGMTVRREVLGDEHVNRAVGATTSFTSDFQELITQYAWGAIWTRPGLDRRSRSMITLTALVARGHHEELAMHVRAARRNGLTVDEIKEVLLQTAIYCGVPDANTAFRIAARVLADDDVAGPPR